MSKSRAEVFAALSREEQEKFLQDFTAEEIEALSYSWSFWGRPEQQEPEGDWWDVWLILAGRGYG